MHGFPYCLSASVYTALTFLAVYGLWTRIGMLSSVLIIFSLAIGFYFLGKWLVIDRPAELDKKLPTSSAELRRRKKNSTILSPLEVGVNDIRTKSHLTGPTNWTCYNERP